MNIVWVTSESVPFAKTGGLADVSGSLTAALGKRGNCVSVIMPCYTGIFRQKGITFDSRIDLLGVPFGGKTQWASVQIKKTAPGVTYYFIECDRYFDRTTLYDYQGGEYADNAERFIFFSRAAMECVKALKLPADILHCNDWHCALCTVYLRSDLYRNDPSFAACRSVLTIHNIGYQGNFDKSNMYWTGLGWEYFNYQCLEYYDRINLLKAGIACADQVNTVSRNYAKEILTEEYSFGLEGVLRHRNSQGKLRGILNGIDVKEWDPASDPLLPACFTAEDLKGKALCKKVLQKHFDLPCRKDVPLFGVLSRLAFQKGLDVLVRVLEDLLSAGAGQFALIGSGERFLEDHLHYLAGKYPEKIGFISGYAPDQTAHLLEAGCDFFIMPSRYEPCGLNQMYSMRYGTLPIVRFTGGLADTVQNLDLKNIAGSTGFVFGDLTEEALRNTVRWASSIYKERPEIIREMRIHAMKQDFSWNRTASLYEQMYHDAHQ